MDDLCMEQSTFPMVDYNNIYNFRSIAFSPRYPCIYPCRVILAVTVRTSAHHDGTGDLSHVLTTAEDADFTINVYSKSGHSGVIA
jgi:hypothetical protein